MKIKKNMQKIKNMKKKLIKQTTIQINNSKKIKKQNSKANKMKMMA